jgi:hypothetical protein
MEIKTFFIKGKVTEYYKGMLITASSEEDALEIYEEQLLSSDLDIDSADLETWNEVETIIE